MTSDGRLLITKIELLKSFGETLKTFAEHNFDSNLTYRETKMKYCQEYIDSWNLVKANYFKIWSKKPENLVEFKIH